MSILSRFITANHHYNLAINAVEHHRYSRALAEFNRTLQLNPRYTLAFINRGKLQQQALGHNRQAAADFERALKLDPHDNQTRYRLAVLYGTLADYQKSARHFRRIMILVRWTQKAGAQAALRDYDAKRYRQSARELHRILAKLDFH